VILDEASQNYAVVGTEGKTSNRFKSKGLQSGAVASGVTRLKKPNALSSVQFSLIASLATDVTYIDESVMNNVTYSYVITSVDNARPGNESTFSDLTVVSFASVGVEDDDALPKTFALEQNYPNPFNPTTTIRYALPEAVNVNVVIYNILGQQVVTLVNREQEAGVYSLKWDGRNKFGRIAASGVYLYRLKAGDFIKTKKMMILK